MPDRVHARHAPTLRQIAVCREYLVCLLSLPITAALPDNYELLERSDLAGLVETRPCRSPPDEQFDTERRSVLRLIAGVAAVTTAVGLGASSTASAAQKKTGPYADPTNPVLEKGNMRLDPKRAALVVIDPQVDFMSPKGLAWPWVGESVTEHNVVQILHQLFMASKQAGMTVAISPHHYYPWDHDRKVQGPLELFQRKNGIFDRKGPIRSMVSKIPALIFCRSQEIHQRWQDHHLLTAQAIWSPDQRSLVPVAQATRRPDRSYRDAGQHVYGVTPARVSRAGFRGRGRTRCDRSTQDTRRRRLSLGADQLPPHSKRPLKYRRDDQDDQRSSLVREAISRSWTIAMMRSRRASAWTIKASTVCNLPFSSAIASTQSTKCSPTEGLS